MGEIIKETTQNTERVIEILRETGALLEGHFILSSGLHSTNYVQCAKVFEYPKYGEEIAKLLAQKIKEELNMYKRNFNNTNESITNIFGNFDCTVVIGPALGGVILAYEVGKFLNTKSMFTEREENVMKLRRGFELNEMDKVIIVEDVVTTGKSTMEVVEVVKSYNATIIGFASIINRSGKDNPFEHLGLPYSWLVKFDFPTYSPAECDMCKKGIPTTKPGSRKIKE
ncbi:MAG: orotate phosphoribosyltransferase [Fervidobacterium sp.]